MKFERFLHVQLRLYFPNTYISKTILTLLQVTVVLLTIKDSMFNLLKLGGLAPLGGF